MSKKEAPIIEAFVYLKNQKVISTKGTVEEDDEFIQFKSGEFLSTIRKEDISCIVMDSSPDLLEIYQKEPISGFEIYLRSGTAQGFNGWQIEPGHFLSKYGDYLEIYEPVAYVKQGPEDPKKNIEEDKSGSKKAESGQKD